MRTITAATPATSSAESLPPAGLATRSTAGFGRESAGVPDHVVEAADARLVIPMREGMRSLNVAIACAMAAGEMMRQTR